MSIRSHCSFFKFIYREAILLKKFDDSKIFGIFPLNIIICNFHNNDLVLIHNHQNYNLTNITRYSVLFQIVFIVFYKGLDVCSFVQ